MSRATTVVLGCIAAFAPAIAQPPGWGPNCVVKGRVIHALTGKPLPKVLISLPIQSRRELDPKDITRAVTDEDGKFSIAGIYPGSYYLSAERDGFVEHERVGPSVDDLKASQLVSGIEIKLIPQSLVRGRLVDRDGDPPLDGWIALSTATFFNGVRTLGGGGGSSRIREDGSFVIGGLRPARYYIHGLRVESVERAGAKISSSELRAEAYGGSTYPDDPSWIVDVGPAVELGGFTVHVASAIPPPRANAVAARGLLTGKIRTVEGTVPEGIGPSAYLILNTTTFPGEVDHPMFIAFKADGTLQSDVGIGRVRAAVTGLDWNYFVKSIRFEGVDVTNREFEPKSGMLDVVVAPQAAVISGKLTGPIVKGSVVTLWAQQRPVPGSFGVSFTVEADEEGNFKFENLPPGAYWIAAWQGISKGLAEYPPFHRAFSNRVTRVDLAPYSERKMELRVIAPNQWRPVARRFE